MRTAGSFSLPILSVALVAALGLATANAWGGISTPLYVGNLVPALDENGQPLSGSNDPAEAALRCRVEIRTTPSIALPPEPSGAPHPGNPLLSTDSVGGMGMNTGSPDSGVFVMSFSNRPTAGTKLFARAYNAPTLEEASFYTDTYIATAPASSSSIVLTFGASQPLDSGDDDGDGLINSWEESLGTDGVATNDFDGDGMGDRDEWLAGTDLKDPNSLLRFSHIHRETETTRPVRVRWQTIPGKSYQLEYIPELLGEQVYIPVGDVVTADDEEWEMEKWVDVPEETTVLTFRVRLVQE